MNSTRDNYYGDNLLGARGNDEFFHPEVVAVNKFRQAMNGQVEDIRISEDGEVVAVNRGDKGVAVINFALEDNTVELPTSLPDGEYCDVVYGQSFKVSNGMLQGNAGAETTYILIRK
jgi:alpha-amylase